MSGVLLMKTRSLRCFRITGSKPFSHGPPALLSRPSSPSLKGFQPFAHGLGTLLARAPRPSHMGCQLFSQVPPCRLALLAEAQALTRTLLALAPSPSCTRSPAFSHRLPALLASLRRHLAFLAAAPALTQTLLAPQKPFTEQAAFANTCSISTPGSCPPNMLSSKVA